MKLVVICVLLLLVTISVVKTASIPRSSDQDKKNILTMIKHALQAKEKICNICGDKGWTKEDCDDIRKELRSFDDDDLNSREWVLQLAKNIAHRRIATWTLGTQPFQDYAKSTYFQGYYANKPGRSSYMHHSNINYGRDNLNAKNWANQYKGVCNDKLADLSNDELALKTMLMISFLEEEEKKSTEMNQRTVLYRLQKFYNGWESDFKENKDIVMDRFIAAAMPENGKTFITQAELKNSEVLKDFQEMFITINIPRNRGCGVNLRPILAKFSDNEKNEKDQREVLIPPGTSFKVTKVEKTKRRGNVIKAKIEMECLDSRALE